MKQNSYPASHTVSMKRNQEWQSVTPDYKFFYASSFFCVIQPILKSLPVKRIKR